MQNLGRELEETKTLVGAKDKVISDLNLEVEKAKGRLGEAQAKVNNIPTIHSLQTQLAQMKVTEPNQHNNGASFLPSLN